jgi:hypothetical protein
MIKTECKMSCTDGLIGNGVHNPNKKYLPYNAKHNINIVFGISKRNAKHYYRALLSIYRNKGSNLFKNGFPDIWTLDFLKIHNCIICSSVLIEKDILDKISNFKNVKNGQEDYDCWLRALEHTNVVYVKDLCFYYDNNHGNGQNY